MSLPAFQKKCSSDLRLIESLPVPLPEFQIQLTKKGHNFRFFFQKVSMTKSVPLKWYSLMKIIIRKIPIIFDIENLLWKSEIGNFCQLNSKLLQIFWSVTKVMIRIWCGTWNSNLKSYLSAEEPTICSMHRAVVIC